MRGAALYITTALLQFTQYLVLTVNFRAIAHAQYAAAGLSASLAAVLAAVVVRRIVRDDSWGTVVAMAVGGGLADMTGIWLTRHWGG